MAVRQIERAVILYREDIDTIHAPFASKGNGDPLVKAFRDSLKSAAPQWLSTLGPDGDQISKPRLRELVDGIEHRRRLLDLLPDGKDKADNLATLAELDELVTELLGQLGDGDEPNGGEPNGGESKGGESNGGGPAGETADETADAAHS